MLIVGHRGAAGLKPENTLESLALALDLGVDWLECDIRLTKDGKVVIIHDALVDRTTNGTGNVSEMSLAEIRSLDAGGGEKVPLLEEFLNLLRLSSAMSEVEVKAVEALEPALEQIKNMRMLDQVAITGKFGTLIRAKELCPDIRIGLPSANPTLDDIKRMASIGGNAVGIRYPHLTKEIVKACHDLGLEARGWNPVTPETIELTMSFGVDSVTTDRPDLALEIRAKMGLWTGRGRGMC